jgi:hypothetical protein
MDCDAPLALPGGTATDLIDRLNMMPLNLIRFSRWTFSDGAYAEDPFSGYGAQKKAIILPPGGEAHLTDRTFGAATVGHNGGAYNKGFVAYIRGGDTAATVTGGFRDSGGGALSSSGFADPAVNDAADDVTFNITDTPTLFTWEHIASDDPDWYAAVPANARFKFFDVTGLSAGSEIVITEYQLQLDDFYQLRPLELPWRPARGEENLSFYGDYIVSIGKSDLAAKSGERIVIDPVSGTLVPAPSGDRAMSLDAETYALVRTDDGRLLRSVGDVTVEVQAYADSAMRVRARVDGLITDGGSVTIDPAPGVTVNLYGGQGLVVEGEGVQWTLYQVAQDVWDLKISGPAAASTVATAAEDLSAGEVCNYYADSGAKARLADATTLADGKAANCFVLANADNGDPARVYFPGQWISGLSGLTPGATYWLDTTPGAISDTPPAADAGHGSQVVGYADATGTRLFFFPQPMFGI